MANGYVKLWRSTLDWEWRNNLKTLRVWIHLLLSANWEDGNSEGVEVPIGSLLTSLEEIARQTKLTKDEVRTAIKHLKNTGEITTQIPRKGILITIENWAKYQGGTDEEFENLPRNSHALPTDIRKKESKNKEYININNNINNNSLYFVTPTLQEVQEFITSKGYSVDAEMFYNYYEANGWKVGRNKMKSWKSTLAYWNSKNKPKEEFF